MHVVKELQEEEHWPRLTKDKVFEKRHIKCDWSRYVDEDDEHGDDGFDMSALGPQQGASTLLQRWE